jgi:azurin
MQARIVTGLISLALGTALAAAPQKPAAPAAYARSVVLMVGDPVGVKMEYSRKVINAKPGERLKVELMSMGKIPKVVMAHNFVLLKLGSDALKFADVAANAKDTDYIPTSLKAQILATAGMVGPGERSEVTFTAPTVPGTYPFLCTFPAHFAAGMNGQLIVK